MLFFEALMHNSSVLLASYAHRYAKSICAHFILPALTTAFSAYSALAGSEYYPLKVGNDVTWAVTFYSVAGTRFEGAAHRRIESTVEKDGKTYFRSRVWFEGLPGGIMALAQYTRLDRKDDKAEYSIYETIEGLAEQIEVVFPLKAGAKTYKVQNDMFFTNTVIGLERVEVSGKTYENCFHMRSSSSDGSYVEDYWEAPVVGNVKSEIVYGSGFSMTLTIKEFKPRK
jgi:hypothetical protein